MYISYSLHLHVSATLSVSDSPTQMLLSKYF